MDLMKTDYEFLDLSDVKGPELQNLKCALYEAGFGKPSVRGGSLTDQTKGGVLATVAGVAGGEGAAAAGECDMAPASPARAAPPPPPYAPHAPYHHHQWPPAPPNVYVSQVTANVNVHGYMGQYYQPPQPAYVPPPAERPPRNNRRERRTKRAPSPPPPPYYVQYPQYYPAAQAQGAPLYHLPMYQPLVYGPYAYPPYAYPDYPMPVEGDPNEKVGEEYQQEVVMEQEAVEAYYGGGHYGGPAYGAGVEGVEYLPPMYLPPPHAAPALPPHPHSHSHQLLNVHAKNFVQATHKQYVPQEKPPPPPTASAAIAVEALPMKDLKIAKEVPSPKPLERPVEPVKTQPILEKPPSPPKVEVPKPSWVPSENKDVNLHNKNFPLVVSAASPIVTANKVPPSINKAAKGPAAPFSGNKPSPKLPVPQTAVPVQQQAVTTPKAPFGNRQKREGTMNRSPSSDNAVEAEKPAPPVVEHVKREPPLPPSKAPMPISITMGPQGPPTIVANKPPFGHSRKVAPVPDPAPAPQPPPPAPTASDFPPPPTPRNRGEPTPAPVVQPQLQPAPGKSWASLFSSKTSAVTTIAPVPLPEELPPSPTIATPPIAPNVQKPVAKVPPFDASPSQAVVDIKAPPVVRPAVPTTTPTISYSEKTSVNAVSNVTVAPTTTKPTTSQPTPEIKEVPVQKETPPSLPVAPSPFSDDPNSYRMGEFLIKYQLDNRPVNLMPRGLTNRSNYCYVNAILQALIACPPFYNMLKALPYQTRKGKSSTPVIDSMVELCYEFSGAPTPAPSASLRRRGEGGVTVPGAPPLDGATGLRVLRALRPFPGSQEGRQEDAEEFLGCLLNSLNDEMLELMKLVEPDEPKDISTPTTPNGVITQEPIPDDEDDDDEWKVMGRRNRGAVERRWAARRTPLGDVFRGATRLRLTRAPTSVTDAVQPFFTLQLDLQRASSVKDALELLAGKDTLEGVDAWQQLSIEQLPVVLLFHLKCFQLDADGHTAKIVKSIDFPVDLKIDPKIMSSKQKYTSKQRLYKLFAVVYHEGVEAVKGHYLTDTYHGQAGWIRYDDSTVTQVTEAAVLKPKAPRMPYLLMYRRHDTLPVHRVNPKE